MQNIIHVRNVSKSFSNHQALSNASIEIKEGIVFGLLGPNGAGKTTLIRILNQIIAPDSGEIMFKEQPLSAEDIRHFGYLPEERGLYKKMKVGEQALYLARLKGLSKQEANKRLKYWFEKLKIGSWWDKRIEELSKGMAQKVQFVTTIIHEPSLLIFDEPFSGFDPINANMLKNEIKELKEKGTTIILSSHNMSSVEELCDDIALINRSKVILQGNVEEIRHSYRKNIFELSFTGNHEEVVTLAQQHYHILKSIQNHHIHTITLQAKGSVAENDLLKIVVPHVQVLSFKEVLPGMEEIFIENVKKSQE
ncbi:MAG TPA: ATP-binding cassette domain-containing protein [Bacteroidales bacterium]|nr:ATP-binding cassette domain-containing protein [Bacteroidales bacterium]